MTNKIQYSKKFDDGSIVVVGGDTVEEFEKNYDAFRKSEVVKAMFAEIQRAKPEQQASAPKPASNGEVERVILPENALLSVIYKKDGFYGEVEPFPGTKFPVRVWPEVLETIEGFEKGETFSIEVGEWECEFARNEKGYPSKIIRFI